MCPAIRREAGTYHVGPVDNSGAVPPAAQHFSLEHLGAVAAMIITPTSGQTHGSGLLQGQGPGERMGGGLQKCVEGEQGWRTLGRLSWAHCWISSGVRRSGPVTTGSPDPAPSSPEASLPNCSCFEVVCVKMPNGARCEGYIFTSPWVFFPPSTLRAQLDMLCSETTGAEREQRVNYC